MKSKDLMTTNPVVIAPDTPVAAIAELLAARGISAVPVVDAEGVPLGVVTEGDLIRRLADRPPGPLSWFLQHFGDSTPLIERFAKAHGKTAQDVMTKELLTVSETESVERVAQLMEQHHIRRVLVVKGNHLVGIISRADLLRALLRGEVTPQQSHDDHTIQVALAKAMRAQPWVDTFWVYPSVKTGTVTFHGFARNDATRQGLAIMARAIPGVVAVQDKMAPMPLILRATF
ncbi:CBS domain-containing protein [Sediminicoccus rosea]|jgi:CBS domain-containing protein|uniref:CBS domain-containing protein n=1 Tax=Sediminicoccus rosea TaxID=1225128 RepID=A0ABZ0PFU3_9PROT|nr:CBS domain-containing protein [Sediminicoccus rosea]WPB84322.1 CBS domain-containing protein [Sediminicoccus rosea]